MVLAALVLCIEVTPSRRDEAYIHQATTTYRLGSISATLSDEHLPKLAAVPGHKPTAPIVGDLWGRRTLSPAHTSAIFPTEYTDRCADGESRITALG